MPGYKTHVVGGMCTFTLLFCLLQKPCFTSCSGVTALSYLFATIFGSLFPDVDTKSKGQMLFYQGILLYLLYLLWYQKIMMFMIMTCVVIIPLLVPHRGLFHNIGFVTLMMAMVTLTAYILFPGHTYEIMRHIFFFYVGALSHIVLDRLQTAVSFKK